MLSRYRMRPYVLQSRQQNCILLHFRCRNVTEIVARLVAIPNKRNTPFRFEEGGMFMIASTFR